MAPTSPYIELHAHSAFSFLDGASTPLELAEAAEAHGYEALALTDHDGIWGSREFAESCKGLELRPITGAELTLAPGSPFADGPASRAGGDTSARRTPAVEPDPAHLTLLVENAAGYRNLCRLLTAAHSHTRDNPGRSAGRPGATLEQAVSVAVSALWIASFALTYSFPLINHALGNSGTFWGYSAISLLGSVFIYLFVPETKGRTLEEIETRFLSSS